MATMKVRSLFDVEARKREQDELCRLFYQVAWALIALCVLKKDVGPRDLSQFNGLLRDAHSRGKSSFSNDDGGYFWSIYLHERAEKVLGLERVNEERPSIEEWVSSQRS